MSVRRKGRELALQALYQLDARPDEPVTSLAVFWDTVPASPAAKRFARELVDAVLARQEEIDQLVERTTRHWRLDRVSRVELCAIRIAASELLTAPDRPVEVIIDEAIEIARKYGTPEGGAFVNGVLDAIAEVLGRKRRASGGTSQ